MTVITTERGGAMTGIATETPLETSAYETAEKLRARETNVALYRELTGNYSIPAGKSYVTLAALQTTNPTSEINQMVALGLCTREQFVGVDNVEALIIQNRINHPDARWYHGEWVDVLLENDLNPGCIYLDTMNEAGPVALNLTASTMRLSPVGTVILLNVCQSSPYRNTMTDHEFMAGLSSRIPHFERWIPAGGVRVYEYAGSSTLMRTFAFLRAR